MKSRNRLLRACSAEDFALLYPNLRRVTSTLKQVLLEPYAPMEQIFFPEEGFASITHHGVELGLIGREGVVGALSVLLDNGSSPYAHFIQMPGDMLVIGIGSFRAATARSSSLHRLLLRFSHVQLVQAQHTAFANARFNSEARLARWLLMCNDRVDGDTLNITHEFLAMMLGTQRTGVTMALQSLEGNRLIKARRGQVDILNRKGLEVAAGEGYGMPELEYKRFIGRS